jgi:hypothetical protein
MNYEHNPPCSLRQLCAPLLKKSAAKYINKTQKLFCNLL